MRRPASIVFLALLVASGVASGAACGGDDGRGGTAPLEVQVVRWAGPPGKLLDLRDGDSLELEAAPQGGHYFFVGARVRGLGHDRVTLGAHLSDQATGKAISGDARNVNMLAPSDGWRAPEHETFTTLPMVQVCPLGVGLDLVGRPLVLRLSAVEIATGRRGQAEVVVRPGCPDEFCACECRADYQPGTCE